jgi:glutamyl-tRNA(Gln) amidotransferase subunit D
MPRSEYSAPDFIEIKLENNYNVGINVSEIQNIKKIGKREANYKLPETEFPHNKNLPKLQLLGTGGTVASRLDYTTGAVIPSFTPSELFSSVPELAEICNLDCEIVFEILSENMKFEYWQKLAEKVKQAVDSGFEFTSAALSFMLKDLSIPVVLTGSQRSSDRPSSDAALNLINAATVATSDIAEVVVSMLGSPSHDYGLIHRGTIVRKMHSSVRDTFRTIDDIPLGMVRNRKIKTFKNNYRKRSRSETTINTNFEKKVALIYSYPGMAAHMFIMLLKEPFKRELLFL